MVAVILHVAIQLAFETLWWGHILSMPFSIITLVVSKILILWISPLFLFRETFTKNNKRGCLFLSMTFWTRSTESSNLNRAEEILVFKAVVKSKFLVTIIYEQNLRGLKEWKLVSVLFKWDTILFKLLGPNGWIMRY